MEVETYFELFDSPEADYAGCYSSDKCAIYLNLSGMYHHIVNNYHGQHIEKTINFIGMTLIHEMIHFLIHRDECANTCSMFDNIAYGKNTIIHFNTLIQEHHEHI